MKAESPYRVVMWCGENRTIWYIVNVKTESDWEVIATTTSKQWADTLSKKLDARQA